MSKLNGINQNYSLVQLLVFFYCNNFFLILAFYYFIKIFEYEEIKYLEKNFNLLIIFSTLSITIKLSTFVSPILVIIGIFEIIKRKVKLKNIFPSIFICFIFSFVWLMQQFIYSSCFIPFFEFELCLGSQLLSNYKNKCNDLK